MKLEEAIKAVRKFNQENRYRDCGKINNSIDMVLQKLDYYKREYEVSQLQLHLLREETNNQINNSIPKEKVKIAIEKINIQAREHKNKEILTIIEREKATLQELLEE